MPYNSGAACLCACTMRSHDVLVNDAIRFECALQQHLSWARTGCPGYRTVRNVVWSASVWPEVNDERLQCFLACASALLWAAFGAIQAIQISLRSASGCSQRNATVCQWCALHAIRPCTDHISRQHVLKRILPDTSSLHCVSSLASVSVARLVAPNVRNHCVSALGGVQVWPAISLLRIPLNMLVSLIVACALAPEALASRRTLLQGRTGAPFAAVVCKGVDSASSIYMHTHSIIVCYQ